MVSDSKKIVVAMSGGVDSSVAAALLKNQGHDLIGISLQLWNYGWDTDHRFGTCCSLDVLADARRVAERVGIPFYILSQAKKNWHYMHLVWHWFVLGGSIFHFVAVRLMPHHRPF